MSLRKNIILIGDLLVRIGLLLTIIVVTFIHVPKVKAEVNNQNIALLVNINDKESIEIAEYYKKARNIPDKNIVTFSFQPGKDVITRSEFQVLWDQLKKQVKPNVQAYVLAWRRPWKVDCMSVTSAFTFGFDEQYCALGCKRTKKSIYYNSQSVHPFDDMNIRPAMMLAASNIEGVKTLIDRGVAADATRPAASAYLLSTTDKHRNVRSMYYPIIESSFANALDLNVISANSITGKKGVMFYFTGSKMVEGIDQNKYLPGAIADHLTSTGGMLFDDKQMSVLKWIDAGVTGSYGTVVEPCNFTQKFPHPGMVIKYYLSGNSLIEAYWKSVIMPGQGLFVGEPLSTPYKGCELENNTDKGTAFMVCG